MLLPSLPKEERGNRSNMEIVKLFWDRPEKRTAGVRRGRLPAGGAIPGVFVLHPNDPATARSEISGSRGLPVCIGSLFHRHMCNPVGWTSAAVQYWLNARGPVAGRGRFFEAKPLRRPFFIGLASLADGDPDGPRTHLQRA